MKKLGEVWLKSLGLTTITFIFSQAIYNDSSGSPILFLTYLLLPIVIEIWSIVMVFKTKANLGKKIVTTLFLPSSIYLYFIIFIIFVIIVPLVTEGLFRYWP